VGVVVKRFDVYLVALDPTMGAEMQKTRPCLIISPDDMNRYLATAIVAPMTSRGKNYPTRVACRFQGKDGQVVLDQIRTIDQARLIKRLGRISTATQKAVFTVLADLFAV